MKTIKWEYCHPLKDKGAVEATCNRYKIKLPKKIMDCIMINNNGRPSAYEFTTTTTKDTYLFNNLYSYNKEDANYLFQDELEVHLKLGVYPLGVETGGNTIGYDLENQCLVLVNWELQQLEYIQLESNLELFNEFLPIDKKQ